MGKNTILVLLLLVVGMTMAEEQTSCGALVLEYMSSELATVMIDSTGKGINDLGNYDQCRLTPGLRYGTVSAYVGGMALVHIGMCVPANCTAAELSIIPDAIVSLSGGAVPVAYFQFPEEVKIEMTTGRVLGFILFSVIGVFILMGLIVEYTPLFNKPARNGEEPPKDIAQTKNMIGKTFISFSPARNMRKLFYSPFDSTDNLKVLNGVRVLSMLYVVLGHAYFNVLLIPSSNPSHIPDLVHPIWFQIMPGGFFAVDVFFFLSAFLGVYLLLQKFHGKRMNFFMIYFHRFYRLAPNILLLIVFFTTFYDYFGNGPVWHQMSQTWTAQCNKYWWSFVLFINSIYPGDGGQCVGWLWYVSHDTIFFLTLPFQALAYMKNRKVGYIVAFFILLVHFLVVMSITIHYDISSSILNDSNYGSKLYFRPWARFGAYQVGIVLGLFYYEFKKGDTPEGNKSLLGYRIYKSIQISSVIRWILYVTGLALIIFLVFIITPENRNILTTDRFFPSAFNALYNPLCRPLYVLGLGMILAGPLVGKGSFLQVFLGSRFWAPWAKIAFYTYLVHLFVFTFYFGQMRTSFYLNHKAILWSYCGVIFLAISLAVPMSVCFEAPWMQLERLVLFPPRKKRTEKTEELEKPMKINESNIGNNSTRDDLDHSGYSAKEMRR